MVILVMGVTGAGKSTVGRALARRVNGQFYDADDYHSVGNVAKMHRGDPLTHEDREAWLNALRSSIDAWLREDGVIVLACSALTERIRHILGADRDGVHLVHLSGSKDLIAARMRDREHFMPPALLDSQFALLEPPKRALDLDVSQSPEELVTRIMNELKLT